MLYFVLFQKILKYPKLGGCHVTKHFDLAASTSWTFSKNMNTFPCPVDVIKRQYAKG